MIEPERIFAHLHLEFRLFVQDWLEIGMADAKSIYVHHGLVCVLSFLSKYVFIAANDALWA